MFVLLSNWGRAALGLVREEAAALRSVGMVQPGTLDRLEQYRVILSDGTSIGLVPVNLILLEPGNGRNGG